MTENEKLIAENEELQEKVELLKKVLETVNDGLSGMNSVFHALKESIEESARQEAEAVDPDEYKYYIHLMSCLINYHKRMVGPLENVEKSCGKEFCRALAFEDMYLKALEEGLRLMKRELKRTHEEEAER